MNASVIKTYPKFCLPLSLFWPYLVAFSYSLMLCLFLKNSKLPLSISPPYTIITLSPFNHLYFPAPEPSMNYWGAELGYKVMFCFFLNLTLSGNTVIFYDFVWIMMINKFICRQENPGQWFSHHRVSCGILTLSNMQLSKNITSVTPVLWRHLVQVGNFLNITPLHFSAGLWVHHSIFLSVCMLISCHNRLSPVPRLD